MGGFVDIERKGWQLIIYGNERDFSVTVAGCVDELDSDRDDFGEPSTYI